MVIPASQLQKAIELFLRHAYAGANPPGPIQQRVDSIRHLSPADTVSQDLLEPFDTGVHASSTGPRAFALRLGQPMYPHMKLVIEPAPPASTQCSQPPAAVPDYLYRADAHDRHLHAPPGSPDAAWLASIRASNKTLTEKIESAWSEAGIPTFKDYLRLQLSQRKQR